ncbi:hypothetical protein ACJJI3_07265 [Microbulbifer sp. ZKSA004]|uniref:hypothetical protein n=1 Tax=Microbulbifer sp. ZKSA004 TaxID=3243389 RepID=UPI004039B188
MEVPISQEFVKICKQIKAKPHSISRWSEIESDDMFHSDSFRGGFDADEQEFCFSFYDQAGDEYWFQVSLSSIIEIASGIQLKIVGRAAE